MAATTATDRTRLRPGHRRAAHGPDRITVLLLTVAAFLGVLSLLARELEAKEPKRVVHPIVVIRKVYETRVIETVLGAPASGTGTSVSQSTSNSGPVSYAPAVATRSS